MLPAKRLKTFFEPIHYLPNKAKGYKKNKTFTLGKGYWVIPRSECLFTIIETEITNFSELEKLVEVKIISWSPFEDTGHYFSTADDRIYLWIWDSARQDILQKEHKALQFICIPESAFKSLHGREGVSLIKSYSGVEAQIIKDGKLLASRWWPTVPSSPDWKHFLLNHELSPCEVPNTQEIMICSEPSLKMKQGFLRYWINNEHILVFFCIGLCLLYGMSLFSTGRKYERGISKLEQSISTKQIQVAPILNDRNTANEKLAALIAMQQYGEGTSQLSYLGIINEILPVNSELLKWNFNMNSLDLTIMGDNLDPKEMVEKLGTQKNFTDVVAERTRNNKILVVKLKINKLEI